MKKLLSVLFISSFVLFSCTKDVNCDCGGGGGGADSSLVGYWQGTKDGSARAYGIFIGTDFSGNFYDGSSEYGGSYSCDGSSYVSFITTYSSGSATLGVHWTGSYSISGSVMTLDIVDGDFRGNYTFVKQ